MNTWTTSCPLILLQNVAPNIHRNLTCKLLHYRFFDVTKVRKSTFNDEKDNKMLKILFIQDPISKNSIRPFSTTTKTPVIKTATKESTNGKGNKEQPSASTKNPRSNNSITQNSTSTTHTKNESSTIPRNTSSNIPNAHKSSKEDSKNVVTIAVVASLVTMINIILSICLIKRL